MGNRFEFRVAGDNLRAQFNRRGSGEGVGQGEGMVSFQSSGLPEDLGGSRDDLERQGQQLSGNGLRPFLADPPHGEVVDFGKVDLMKQKFFPGAPGLDQQVLDGLGALFVLYPGHDGE